MYMHRSAARAAPLLLRSSGRSLRPAAHRLPRMLPAFAIVLPHRPVSTEPSPGPPRNYPPPGFDAAKAREPLSSEAQREQNSGQSPARDTPPASTASPPPGFPRDGPTAHPKTPAKEAASLSELAAEKAAIQPHEEKKVEQKAEETKPTLWQKVKKEVVHYWDGTKLLVTEVRISSRLALKMAAGYELTRRENRQVCTSTCDHRRWQRR